MTYSRNLRTFEQFMQPKTYSDKGRISEWYRHIMKPNLTYINQSGRESLYQLNQTGGETLTGYSDGQKYNIEVEILQKHLKKSGTSSDHQIKQTRQQSKQIKQQTRQQSKQIQQLQDSDQMYIDLEESDSYNFGNINEELLFFHYLNPREDPCGTVEIYPESKTAYINTLYDCFTPIGAKKPGRILILVILDYLKTNQHKYDINRIVLQDSSEYKCHERGGLTLPLELSRQLSGQNTYYEQFGFKPIQQSSQIKLLNNLEKLVGVKVNTYKDDILTILVRYIKLPYQFQKVIELLKSMTNEPITDFFKQFALNYCRELSLSIDEIFDILKLEKLSYYESFYELNL